MTNEKAALVAAAGAAGEETHYNKVSRKHLAPIFIRDILKKYTDYLHPCSQKFICEKLAEAPYELNIERKAVGKHLKTMSKEDIFVYGNGKDGYWYDRFAYYEGRAT